MRFNSVWLIVSSVIILAMVLYFSLNPSYQQSLEAKYYFTVGDYEKAQIAATEAFTLNSYNKMAATIMTQSQVAVKFVKYNTQAKEYTQRIAKLAAADSISEADRAKIRTMCVIMIDEYIKISPSVVIDKALVNEAKQYYEKFLKLHEKVTQ
jgi:tetratricopeptide (TPR) repeat protein